jgi:hypothetical protein
MKPYIHIAILCLFSTNLYAQKIDTRVDNMVYWTRLIAQGLVKFSTQTKAPPAIYKGSNINNPLIALTNSPDILIDNTTGYSESENSVTINPVNISKALNSNNTVDENPFPNSTVSEFTTINQGVNWAGNVNPFTASYSDPATEISNDNHHYIGYIDDFGNQTVAVSINEGATWQSYLIAPGGDKNHLKVDKSLTGNYINHVYAAWVDFGGLNDKRIAFAKSSNSGVSWSSPFSISTASAGSDPKSFDQGVNLQTGPNGLLYATWAIYDTWPNKNGSDESAIGFASSGNGGQTFNSAIRIVDNIRGIRLTKVGKGIRTNSYPTMAVDNSFGPNRGSIYVVWANIGTPGVNTGNDVDVYLIKSLNGGVSWTTPQKVNTSTAGQGKKHFFPWITCDQTTGKLHIIYYDDRSVGSTECETWMSSSFDGGSTWSDYKISDVSFTPVPIIGDYFGDYLGVSANDDVIYPVWTDNRTGKALAYTSPLISNDFCPTSLTIQNITMPLNAVYKYRAANIISIAGGSTSFTMQGNGTTGARASMVASSSITLLPNTTVERGATLTIVPGPCSSPVLLREQRGSNQFTKLKIQQQEFEINSQINIYPNPVKNTIYVELSKELVTKSNIRFVISDLMGSVLAKGTISKNLSAVNISKFRAGGYFLSLYENDKFIETKKFIKN